MALSVDPSFSLLRSVYPFALRRLLSNPSSSKRLAKTLDLLVHNDDDVNDGPLFLSHNLGASNEGKLKVSDDGVVGTNMREKGQGTTQEELELEPLAAAAAAAAAATTTAAAAAAAAAGRLGIRSREIRWKELHRLGSTASRFLGMPRRALLKEILATRSGRRFARALVMEQVALSTQAIARRASRVLLFWRGKQ
jgi:hypothetical protein